MGSRQELVMFGSAKTMLKHRECFQDDDEKKISDYLFCLIGTGYFHAVDLQHTSLSAYAAYDRTLNNN